MKFTYAPETTPLPGFRIKRAIDRGGFGEVYYAVSDSGKEVALKLLQRNEQVELRGVTQCLNLKHPNLVPIYDIKTDAEGDHWVVMEYVAGKSLEQVLEQHPAGMPLPEAERWLRGIAEGIAFLHDRGIVHRDLKPANVFCEGGHVKVGDVGLCKFITPSRRSAQTESVGTVYYMAPEVARGKYSSELDVYSLGVIAYEMVTGRVPFDGESTGEILMKHLTEKPDLTKLPAALRPVLARALEKDPQRRTGSAL
ncbi:MAG: serine/threonine protein kinase, partial [Planctomycetaceae bacterium]